MLAYTYQTIWHHSPDECILNTSTHCPENCKCHTELPIYTGYLQLFEHLHLGGYNDLNMRVSEGDTAIMDVPH